MFSTIMCVTVQDVQGVVCRLSCAVFGRWLCVCVSARHLLVDGFWVRMFLCSVLLAEELHSSVGILGLLNVLNEFN